jgi:peroxiredoxin
VNRLKSIFVLWYPIAVLLILASAVITMVVRGPDLAWSGALLTTLPFIGLYIRATTSRSLARTSHSLPILVLLTLAGGVLAAYGYWRSGYSAHGAMTAAAVGVAGFFLFDFWYSSFGRRVNEKLETGRLLPEFEARDLDGAAVGPSDLRGKPVLYMFYRGNWCPFCMAQVGEITARYRELSGRGVEIVLISPQPTELTQRVAEMFEVPVRFWVDPDLSAANALGIVNEYGVPSGPLAKTYGQHTVMPTVIIVDGEGRILYTDQTDNYRVRPEPDVFFRVLAAHGL